MALIISRRQSSDELRFEWAFGLQQIYDVALVREYRGELFHIASNKDEFPITIANIKEAKANRDRFLRDGVSYPLLPDLPD
ncbi:MAG: hypothetical protein WBG18_21085 [Xanthobacteraceae bacterium]